jgi:hypothetical protein
MSKFEAVEWVLVWLLLYMVRACLLLLAGW